MWASGETSLFPVELTGGTGMPCTFTISGHTGQGGAGAAELKGPSAWGFVHGRLSQAPAAHATKTGRRVSGRQKET